ncbi:MAG TPA: nuclear transport factor 2 family protein [Gaiellaceae bacterium]|nr:nuclear transport factor 2 family protein [Gaiellaceae bacterium]
MAGPDPLDVFDAFYRTVCDDRDAGAFMALWADDEDITMWGSDEDERAVGAAQIRALADAIVASPSQLAFAWDDRHVHEEGDVAWVNARGTFTLDGRAGAYRTTAVLVRRDGRWRWHTHSGSEPS